MHLQPQIKLTTHLNFQILIKALHLGFLHRKEKSCTSKCLPDILPILSLLICLSYYFVLVIVPFSVCLCHALCSISSQFLNYFLVPRVYGKQPFYLPRLRFAYTPPSPDPTSGTTIGTLLQKLPEESVQIMHFAVAMTRAFQSRFRHWKRNRFLHQNFQTVPVLVFKAVGTPCDV